MTFEGSKLQSLKFDLWEHSYICDTSVLMKSFDVNFAELGNRMNECETEVIELNNNFDRYCSSELSQS